MLRRETLVALLTLMALHPVPGRSELVYNGTPTEAGRQVGDAVAQVLAATAWFYDSLAEWERQSVDGTQVRSQGQRIEAASASWRNFIGRLDDASGRLNAILASEDPTVRDALDAVLEETSAPVGFEDREARLRSRDHAVPSTYRDVVLIARWEVERLRRLAEGAFSGDARVFRLNAYRLSQEIEASVAVGMAVATYVRN